MGDEFNPGDKYENYVLKRYTGISACRAYSIERLGKLRALVGSYFDTHESARKIVSCVAVCGSLGRLESSENSDFDIVTVALDENDVTNIHADLLRLAKSELGVSMPNPKGAFAIPSSTTILSRSSGDQSEDARALGLRLHIALRDGAAKGLVLSGLKIANLE